MRTIAQAHNDYENIWDNQEFVEEINSRAASYEKGTAKVFKFEEMKKTAIEAYQAKKVAE